jgi:AcrR family transcriptional regulator
MSPGERTPRGAARENILSAALALFYSEGVQAVGVDRIAEQSGVAKVTLYRHFPTKDALLAAVLERANDAYLLSYRAAMDGAGEDPRERIPALFRALDKLTRAGSFNGCIFINTRLELGADHPSAPIVRAHKDAIGAMLAEELTRAGHAAPEEGAEQLLMLIDATLLEGALRPERRPGRTAGALAGRIIA